MPLYEIVMETGVIGETDHYTVQSFAFNDYEVLVEAFRTMMEQSRTLTRKDKIRRTLRWRCEIAPKVWADVFWESKRPG